jgi:glutamyl-tRNA synthetase
MSIKVRFAPSPTGFIHLGNARMASLNYFLSTKLGGEYILRIDDTDFGRVKPEYIDGLREDLKWLGINWVQEFSQSNRLDIYNSFLQKLIGEGRVYECFESAEELEYKKKLQLAKGKPPIYDRAMLSLSQAQKAEYLKEGRKPYYRLKMEYKEIKWVDMIKGEISFRGENISDPVLVREDGSFLYILTSVIDDIEKNITHIIRGEDHIVNTAVQIQMFEYLKAPLPSFAHLPLITNNQGEGFSKRDGALSIRGLRVEGMQPMALHNYLFALGMGEQNKIYESIEEIAKDFDMSKYNGSAAKFDEAKLLKLNLHFLQKLSFEEIKNLTLKYLNLNIEENFWNLIKFNIEKFNDIQNWYNICYNEITTLSNSLKEIMLNTIPQEDFVDTTWSKWLEAIKANTSLVGKDLFKSIRLNLSGREDGPELKHLICIIGKDLLKKRLAK